MVDWKIKSCACVLARNQDFAIKRGLNTKVQMSKLGDVLSELV